MEKTKAEAAAYAPEILMLAQAIRALRDTLLSDEHNEIRRRLRVLLDLEPSK
jgi:hypothetical protein